MVKWKFSVVAMLAMVMAVVAMPVSATCSNLSVYYSVEDGEDAVGLPMNRLLDETCGLTAEQAKAHHYTLKASVGEAYIAATAPGVSRSGVASSDAFSAAVMGAGKAAGGAGAGERTPAGPRVR